jgi:hypothetical protein
LQQIVADLQLKISNLEKWCGSVKRFSGQKKDKKSRAG